MHSSATSFTGKALAALLALSAMLVLLSPPVRAAEPAQRRAVFPPFHVGVQDAPAHLAEGLAAVLAGRVAAQARVSAVTRGKNVEQMRQALKKGDHAAFGRLLAASGVDYLVLGGIAPGGSGYEASAYVFSRNGGAPRRLSRFFSNVDDPLPAVEELAADVSAIISGRGAGQTGAVPFTTANPERAYRRNALAESVPGLDQGDGDFQLTESLRGRPLDVEVLDMGRGDVNGDGSPDLVLLAGKSLEMYRYENGRFTRWLTHPLPEHLNHLALTMVDANGNGVPELYIGASNGNQAASSVWEWRDGRLARLEENVPYYLHAVALPQGEAMLLGQQPPPGEPAGGKIHLMRYEGGRLQPSGRTLPIIEGYNVYDVVPADLDGDGKLEIVAISRDNRLQVFKAGALLWTSADEYGAGRNFYGTLTAVSEAMQNDVAMDKEPSYLHTRIVTADLDLDGLPEVIVAKNREVTPLAILPGLRYFDDSAIAGLKWDGNAMRLLWETRRHPGYIIGYQAVPDPAASRLELFFAAEDGGSILKFWDSPDTRLHRLVLSVRARQ